MVPVAHLTLRDGSGSAGIPGAAADVSSAAREEHKAGPPDAEQRGQDDRASQAVDAAKLWEELCAKIPARGFLRTLVDSVTVIGTNGRNFILAYRPEEKSSIETLATPSNQKQLQELLNQISGRDWTLKLTAKEGLPLKRASARGDDYEHDPLIREALEVFKGEIKS